MQSGWTERGDPFHFVAELEAMDVARRDAAELARFGADVTAPRRSNEPQVGRGAILLAVVVFALAWAAHPAVATVLLCVVALVLLVLWLASRNRVVGSELLGRARARLQFSAPPDLARFTDRFVIAIDATKLEARGTKPGSSSLTVPLADVASIGSGRRLTLHLVDGTTRQLPCTLLDGAQHAAFAARLDDVMRRLRAEAGDYRGRRVEEAAGPDAASPHESESPAVAASGADDAVSGSARHSRP